jgi:hypothetical protein
MLHALCNWPFGSTHDGSRSCRRDGTCRGTVAVRESQDSMGRSAVVAAAKSDGVSRLDSAKASSLPWMRQTRKKCVVGASLTGLSLAEKVAKEPGFSVVLLEAARDSRGIWASTANNKPQLQIEHYIYCDLENLPDCSSSYPSAREIQSFLQRKARKLQTLPNVDIRYGCKVVALVDLGSAVQVKYTDSDQRFQTEIYSSVHIQTGSLSQPRSMHIPGLQRHLPGVGHMEFPTTLTPCCKWVDLYQHPISGTN